MLQIKRQSEPVRTIQILHTSGAMDNFKYLAGDFEKKKIKAEALMLWLATIIPALRKAEAGALRQA